MPTSLARTRPRAVVIVLGDLGRSPRMLNHALSLVAHGWQVDLVGHAPSTLPAEARVPGLMVRAIDDESAPRSMSRPAWALRAAGRGLSLTARLLRVLLTGPAPDVVLVQNPPGIPTLPVAWLAARVRGSRFVIDWHNFTASMLALRLGPRHPVVKVAGLVERWAGRRADHNLFVSEAMARHVAAEWRLAGSVFRDRPRDGCRAPDPARRAQLRARLFEAAGVPADGEEWRLVISPTSWTADEDFSPLVEAARALDAEAHAGTRGVAVVATGRGPLRAAFEARVATLALSRVRLATAWLDADDYPAAVGSADAGLCLHDSASKLDLPMKVMDLFGAGVPVVALDYGPCLAELVQPGVNGLTFTDVPSLVTGLRVVRDADEPALEVLRAGARASGALRWHETWPREVLPYLRRPTLAKAPA